MWKLCVAVFRFPFSIRGFPSERELVEYALDKGTPNDYIGSPLCASSSHPSVHYFQRA